MKPLTKVKCPTCKKEGDWFSGAHGPFCSHRCKLVDLGRWFNQEHVISEPLRPEHLEKYAELSPGKHLDRTGDD
ncbi:MAG TPA: DNA gyrase inhibitor YacG [Candidatus Angelobacter sp.]|nr:DNA gyrase inhibitor YacG [Candidatus Angelobacter sp.]